MSDQPTPVPLFLAPMAGVSDLAFRLLARECGADLTITEFTAAAGLTRRDAKSWHKLSSDPRESPFIPQIFGGVAEEMVHCTEMLAEVADVIDLNFGCPAPKVTRNCAGAALMGHPDELIEMVEGCIAVSEVPITVKMRLGTGNGPETVLELASRLEGLGVARLCIHGRTLRQRYSGVADWDFIRRVVEAVDIPVIANGDIVDARSATACIEATGAAGLMIGRAAIGRPTIFHQIKSELGWPVSAPPWAAENNGAGEAPAQVATEVGANRADTQKGEISEAKARSWAWSRYIELDDELNGDRPNRNRKRHAFAFTKGLPGGKALRTTLHQEPTPESLAERVKNFLENPLHEIGDDSGN